MEIFKHCWSDRRCNMNAHSSISVCQPSCHQKRIEATETFLPGSMSQVGKKWETQVPHPPTDTKYSKGIRNNEISCIGAETI